MPHAYFQKRRTSLLTYIYDGSFEGFLTVCSLVLDQKETIADITTLEHFQPDLFTETREVETDAARTEQFFQSLCLEFSQEVVAEIGNCFLSEVPGIEKVLFDYLHQLFTLGEQVSSNFNDPTVFLVRRTSDKVDHEIVRMQGFVRFRQLCNGVYYAPIEPDHNILQFLAPHFSARFADQMWLIHDVRRKIGIYYDLHHCTFLPFLEMNPEVLTASQPFKTGENPAVYAAVEGDYQALWNQYFHSIAITERTNPKAQRQRMPARYWRYLVEDIR
jgi:probable DNA metabolism protein